ncbi:MAG: ribosomal L7Ae/L30e/S12e/Gadd45 family protein [Clostridiaceae bacterium]
MIQRFDSKFAVGIKQTLKLIEKGEGKFVYIAKDADKKLVGPVIKLAEDKAVEIIYVDTTKELGVLCGIDVGSAAAIILD